MQVIKNELLVQLVNRGLMDQRFESMSRVNAESFQNVLKCVCNIVELFSSNRKTEENPEGIWDMVGIITYRLAYMDDFWYTPPKEKHVSVRVDWTLSDNLAFPPAYFLYNYETAMYELVSAEECKADEVRVKEIIKQKKQDAQDRLDQQAAGLAELSNKSKGEAARFNPDETPADAHNTVMLLEKRD